MIEPVWKWSSLDASIAAAQYALGSTEHPIGIGVYTYSENIVPSIFRLGIHSLLDIVSTKANLSRKQRLRIIYACFFYVPKGKEP